MARANNEHSSLRFGRRESERVVAALLLSLILHFIFWGGYNFGEKRGWWDKFQPPAWLHLPGKKYALDAQVTHDHQPDIFVDVSHADSDAPSKTPFYSNKNSRAANQDAADSNAPKINGTQTDVPRPENVPRLVRQAESKPAPAPATPKETLGL